MPSVSNAVVPVESDSLFAWGRRTFIMGILNATPDSFSGDGLLNVASEPDGPVVIEATLQKARDMVEAGADVLDLGGMSTRPRAPLISEQDELDRVLPIVRVLLAEFPSVPLSVDTYRASVARSCLAAGAILINSIWGVRTPVGEGSGYGGPWNTELASVVADSDALLVLTHNGRTEAMSGTRTFPDIVRAVYDDLEGQAIFAESQGIPRARLIADPGLGFGKTFDDNLRLLQRLDELQTLGLPLLVGTSRKSFLGTILGDVPPSERDSATAATTAWVIPRGADMVRVHDVRTNAMTARILDALYRGFAAPAI